jgi:hypothetical protein
MAPPRKLRKTSGVVRPLIIRAFLNVGKGLSPDRVIADADLNRRFIDVCRHLGVIDSAIKINLTLLNARKAGYLKGIESKRTVLRDQGEFQFASEAAVRFLEQRDQTTLDRILCDPVSAQEFDSIAGSILPGRTSFEYRWAALRLRKLRQLRPELLSRVVAKTTVLRYRIEDIDLGKLSICQGVYLFQSRNETLYIGEAVNLCKRVSKHIDHSDNKGLARWLWQQGFHDLHLELHLLPLDTKSSIRKALEASLIQSRKPRFNVAGSIVDG